MVNLLLAIIYLAFISLGLPDALLGAAWPVMYRDLDVAVSLAGGISLTVAAGTVVSSLLSDRMTNRLGTGKITAISACMTAFALIGFSISTEYWHLLLWAIPYGLGAGSVDASLNNYVAIHYSSRAMSWLHCMWGIGASTGPYILGQALTGGMSWNSGYRYIAVFQLILSVILFLSLPLWKPKKTVMDETGTKPRSLTMGQILAIPGAKEVLVAFFCYCAVEQTAILWASSYFVFNNGVHEDLAATFGSLFLLGLTAGRAISGFLTAKLNDTNMIRLGQGLVVAGIFTMLLPLGNMAAILGLLLIGLGCAPIYPCVIHSTPEHFGEENSQAIIGVQMAAAYVGTFLMPPLFGLIVKYISVALLPLYLGAITCLMIIMCEQLNRKTVH